MTEYSHSFSKDLQWNNQSQLMEHDVPQFQGFAFVVNGGTCAMQRAMNVHLYNSFIELQRKTGTKDKLLQHCLIHLSHSLRMARFNKYLYSCSHCTHCVFLQVYCMPSSIGLALDIRLAIEYILL